MAITTILWVFIPAVPTTAAALTAFCSPGRGLRIILLLGDCQSFHQSPLKVFDCSDICDTLDINPVFQIFFLALGFFDQYPSDRVFSLRF